MLKYNKYVALVETALVSYRKQDFRINLTIYLQRYANGKRRDCCQQWFVTKINYLILA